MITVHFFAVTKTKKLRREDIFYSSINCTSSEHCLDDSSSLWSAFPGRKRRKASFTMLRTPTSPRRIASSPSLNGAPATPKLTRPKLPLQRMSHSLINTLWAKCYFDNVILLLLFVLELRTVSFEFVRIVNNPIQDPFNTEDFNIVLDVNDDDDQVDNIVIKWNHWQAFETVLDSIWEGNLFCEEISTKVHMYYDRIRSMSTDQTAIAPPIPRVHVQIGISCYDLFMNSIHGTGNYIQTIYAMRVSVRFITIAKIKLNVSCVDADELHEDFVLPWFTGIWYSPNYFNSATAKTAYIENKQGPATSAVDPQFEAPSEVLYCGLYYETPTALMYEEMQYDVRRMAVAFMGTKLLQKDFIHAQKVKQFIRDNLYQTGSLRRRFHFHENENKMLYSYLSPGNQQERFNATTHLLPLIPNKQQVELDDAVIHFRCGDLLTTNLTSYGFMTFDAYSRHISPSVRTIGVLTQPFGLDEKANNKTGKTEEVIVQQRTLDTGSKKVKTRCRSLVTSFVGHLQERFPFAKISIRNDRLETITMAYVRFVMANESVGAMSTFSLFPILGSFGHGYVLRPQNADPSGWMINPNYPIEKMSNTIQLFDETNLLLGPRARNLWDEYGYETIMQWFRTGKYSTKSDKK